MFIYLLNLLNCHVYLFLLPIGKKKLLMNLVCDSMHGKNKCCVIVYNKIKHKHYYFNRHLVMNQNTSSCIKFTQILNYIFCTR